MHRTLRVIRNRARGGGQAYESKQSANGQPDVEVAIVLSGGAAVLSRAARNSLAAPRIRTSCVPGDALSVSRML